nr:Chain A, GLY-SER-PRO-LEU-PHE-ASP [Zinnia elegans]6AZG_A Chain A, GLY-SER-PRO-LEU-PHE-ASP [Zinnia elegans]
GSPLFD